MKGYYQMPQETKAVIDDEGWLYTGDLATIDKDGYIRIVGRSKEMIIRGGYNIYPREIEEVLYKHPEVLEAAVVGLPDSVLGEITCSAVRLKSGAKVEAEELKQFIRERLADYKTPDKIVFMHDFPMTPSGKIKKNGFATAIENRIGGSVEMKKMKRRLWTSLMALTLWIATVGCSSASSIPENTAAPATPSEGSAQTIKIGVIVSETGPASSLGKPEAETARLLKKQIEGQLFNGKKSGIDHQR